jgi:hypothetical protein
MAEKLKSRKTRVRVMSQPHKFRRRYRLTDVIFQKEKKFLYFIAIALLLAGFVYPYPQVAMWFGFAFAGYSAIANDSIQTIGTFIASNERQRWWKLWLFMGLIFLGTVGYSWYMYDGDVTFQRLASKGLSESPQNFVFLQLAAPIILLLLTRFRIPVSTTFMLLSVFSTGSGTIMSMVSKSTLGYVIAFLSSVIIYLIFTRLIKRLVKGTAHRGWTIAQWVISGALWSVWLAQDAANIAVYLPRSLSIIQFAAFASFIFFGLGFLFYMKGDKIQGVITEKTEVRDVRSATIIDFIYTIILYFFKELSNIPMSTTWVFIGLLAGRELGMRIRSQDSGTKISKTLRLIAKDLGSVTFGLIVSVLLAIAINPNIQEELKAFFLALD